jgi:hypothetical protein
MDLGGFMEYISYTDKPVALEWMIFGREKWEILQIWH